MSASIRDSKEIPTANPVLLGSENSVAPLVMLYLETGSRKFKMATLKPKLPVFQLLYKIEKKFQRLSHVLGSRNSIALSGKIDVDTGM
jgi:hypothetical protein